jgi:curved DNA-binding protein CbpA
MKFQYFKTNGLTINLTIEEAKRQYKRLILTHHPDLAAKNGMTVEEATKATQTINAEWDYLKAHNYNIHENSDGDIFTDFNQTKADATTERYADIIEQLIHMEGLTIEICGCFIWLGGNTFEHKSEIKALDAYGVKVGWANKKKMWFLAPLDWKKKSRKELTMDNIRETYGSQFVGVGKTAAGRALTA